MHFARPEQRIWSCFPHVQRRVLFLHFSKAKTAECINLGTGEKCIRTLVSSVRGLKSQLSSEFYYCGFGRSKLREWILLALQNASGHVASDFTPLFGNFAKR